MDNLIASNLTHHPGRTLASVAGVATGVILVVLTVGLVRGALRDRGRRDANLPAEIMLSKNGQGGISFATLSVSLPGIDRAQAQQLIDGAHQACPYSHATRGNIEVTINLA